MPEFHAGEQKTAIVPVTNPTEKGFDYKMELYMGTNLAIMAEVPFHLNAGESKSISLPVTMPAEAGTYPIHIGVLSEGELVRLLRATEDVVVAIPLVIDSFIYVYQGAYTWYLTDVMLHPLDITHIGFFFRNDGVADVEGVSVKFRTANGGTVELSPPRDAYNMAIAQPFTAPPGGTWIWYSFSPVSPLDYIATAEVYVDGILMATASLNFYPDWP